MNNVAIVSEHASPLALVGGVDSGGQNIYVANVARQLARSGHRVDVFTRRDNPLLPPIVHWKKNVRVIHVDAGPPRYIAKEELLPYMEQFGDSLAEFFRKQSRAYDVVHANFFMSGLASLSRARSRAPAASARRRSLSRRAVRNRGDARARSRRHRRRMPAGQDRHGNALWRR